ncbi:MAG TPA: hypothetical protein VE198_21885 [Actinoallomurus sp.]|nr:hypothetical protein [Actinoallomurus sp.]
MTDINDFTDYSEPCSCGHTLREHWPTNTGCSGQRREMDTAALPTPEYAPEDTGSPFAWPSNWPPANQCPHVEVPCTCGAFAPADPEPPEDWS